MTQESNCNGCSLSNNVESVCIPYNEDASCPCTLCIVKTMCNDFCDLADNWWNKT